MTVRFRSSRTRDIREEIASIERAINAPIVRDWGTISANATLDIQIADYNIVTLGANITNLTFGIVAVPKGTKVRLIIKQDSTGTRTVTNFVNATHLSGTAPTLTPTASASDYFDAEWTGSTWAFWPIGPNGSFAKLKVSGDTTMTGDLVVDDIAADDVVVDTLTASGLIMGIGGLDVEGGTARLLVGSNAMRVNGLDTVTAVGAGATTGYITLNVSGTNRRFYFSDT